jgi:ABC-2 type transport system permease protein
VSAQSNRLAVEGTRHRGPAAEGIPFSRLVRAELRKLTDTRTSRLLLAAMAAATPVVIAVMLIVASPRDLNYTRLVDFTQTPQKFLLPALAILVVTSEWSQRTGLVTFTLVPGRGRILRAKVTAMLALGLALIAVAFAVAAAGNLFSGLRHGDGSWAFGAPGFGEMTLVQLETLLEGLAFGILLRSSAAAIAAFYLPAHHVECAVQRARPEGHRALVRPEPGAGPPLHPRHHRNRLAAAARCGRDLDRHPARRRDRPRVAQRDQVRLGHLSKEYPVNLSRLNYPATPSGR